MLIYIALFTLILVAILYLVSIPAKKEANTRPHQEPFLGADTIEPKQADGSWTNSAVILDTSPQPVSDSTEDNNHLLLNEKEPSHTASSDVVSTTETQNNQAAQPIATDLLLINLLAEPARPYRGYDLLQVLLTLGLRYGKWHIFHRHENASGRGAILFSLASSVEPGTFNLNDISHFSSSGLTLFMRVKDVADQPSALEIMLNTAEQIVTELGGTVCDEQRLPLSAEKITNWRSILK